MHFQLKIKLVPKMTFCFQPKPNKNENFQPKTNPEMHISVTLHQHLFSPLIAQSHHLYGKHTKHCKQSVFGNVQFSNQN